jgi:TctA family transporter
MNFNFIAIFAAALIPMVVGFIWYNPKTLGSAWMNAAGLTEEKLKGANMPLIFGLSYVFSVLLALGMYVMVVHQSHVMSILVDEPGFKDAGSEINNYYQDFMSRFGKNFRTFKHGCFHGVLGGLFVALPILATNAMFERKGFKYIAINAGYWIITMALMGGVICQFA